MQLALTRGSVQFANGEYRIVTAYQGTGILESRLITCFQKEVDGELVTIQAKSEARTQEADLRESLRSGVMAKNRTLHFAQIPIERAKGAVREERKRMVRVGEDKSTIALQMYLRKRLDTIDGKLEAILRAVRKPEKQTNLKC